MGDMGFLVDMEGIQKIIYNKHAEGRPGKCLDPGIQDPAPPPQTWTPYKSQNFPDLK